MANRINEIREKYEAITERLYKDRNAFAEYLKFAGKFFKISTSQTMVMFASNPNATMVTDYNTWQKYNRQVRLGERSIAVLNGNNKLKHFFDISQTNGDSVPYRWRFDAKTAHSFVNELSGNGGERYKSLSSYVNAIGGSAAAEAFQNAEQSLGIAERDRDKFEKSFVSLTRHFIAARCALDSTFRYEDAGSLDLTALDFMPDKKAAEQLMEHVRLAAKPALLSIERTITNITITERSIDNGRNKEDLVRGESEVLPRNHRGERHNVQARPGNIRVSGTAGAGTDAGRGRADERADRTLGTGVAEIYDGELSRGNPVVGGAAAVGADTPTGGQGSVGVVASSAGTVREGKSTSDDNVLGNRSVGENEELHSKPRSDGAGSVGTQGSVNAATAEENSSAVSVFEYQLLSRLQSDCDYFLGNGAGHEKHLWAGNVEEQIAKMQELWDGFPDDKKPEWLSKEDIDGYAEKMLAVKNGEIEIPSPYTVPTKEKSTSEKVKKEKSFAEQVDASLNGELPFYTALKVCDTPDLLLQVGCEPLPMLYTQSHLRKAVASKDTREHTHGLAVEQIKSLPTLLENPVIIADSPNRSDSIIVITTENDEDRNPVIASIKPNGKGRYEVSEVDSNFITSVYGRNNFPQFLQRLKENDCILFADKQKSQDLLERWGEQYSELTSTLDFNHIIHQSHNIVNTFSEKNQKNLHQENKQTDSLSENKTTEEIFAENGISADNPPYISPNVEAEIQAQQVEQFSLFGTPEHHVSMSEMLANAKLYDDNADKAEVKTEETTEKSQPLNYRITDDNFGEKTPKARFLANVDAIRTLNKIGEENLTATPEEQEVLAKYAGWGGLAQAFDESNTSWANEYKQLQELLTRDEYSAAKSTVLNAHYTSSTIINAIYKGIRSLGFEGGNVLEPAMGIGNFFGVMPEKMRQDCNLHGIELDSISGRIAKQLYQTADIQVTGFEKTTFPDNFFDAAIGNVPFDNYSVSDRRYNRENFLIHDYFLAKSLDKLAPGGIAALITTKGTLDKLNPKVREYLARRGDLIGAIRLPNNAFKNAGTEVTADILFFQKREKMAVEMPDWCYVGKNSENISVNSYFLDHPEMILGKMKMVSGRYGEETACVPIEGAELAEQLDKAMSNLKLTHAIRRRVQDTEKQAGVIPATADVRNFTFAEVDGKLYFRENNIMTQVMESEKTLNRIKGLNKLRNTFRELLVAQGNNCSDETLAELQSKLNQQYDSFVKQYGNINSSANSQIFDKDDDYNSICALEIVDEESKALKKSDFFSKRTVKYIAEITHADTPQEAMQISIDVCGKVDIPYMAQLCGQELQAVVDSLKSDNLIYHNPVNANKDDPFTGWEESSEYLSGNVREKLRTAKLFAKDSPEYNRNVEALTNVLPKKLEAGDITARIGVSWVDVEDYQEFMEDYAAATCALRRTAAGEYKIEHKNGNRSTSATQIYGTKRMPAQVIFENLLNNRDIVVRDKVEDNNGKEYYKLNRNETNLAQEKARLMKEAFKRWLWERPERRQKYVARYNDLFNCIVGRNFDGSRQTLPGMSPSIQLKPHQLDAVMRAKFGGNTLLAHCVGAGKSFEMVAATMEKKRLGLINKACVVVPKHLVGQMANEWLRLYPQAKILTASEKDFTKDNRQKFIGRCCTGNYDAVIMSYEQFEKIPMSLEYRQSFIKREIDAMQNGIDELSESYFKRSVNRGSIKDLEREKKRLETRLQKLIDSGKTKDTSLAFEQLGFDSLVVDEAHNYKNGLVVSKMNRVAGVQTTPAQKSEDILMKTRFLNENFGEKNILFATGTPVSNSMTELYIMQRYLRPSLLENAGLQTFDDWASCFGEVVSSLEIKPAGDGYRTKSRFAKFNNLPELMQMYKEFADIRTADMLSLPVPKIEGGKPQTIVAKPSEAQRAYMQVLAARSEAIHNGTIDPSVDNMLKITNEARLLGLDARSIIPNADNLPDSKVNLCIDKVMDVYNQTADQKGVQAIFCDIAVNSSNGRFSVYDYIKEELVRRGIPESEICTASDAETQKQRNEMYAQLRSGTKRIVLASTSKMGTGANIQTRLAALHNLDIPWRPADIEQRNGRIIRQGNEFKKVGIYNYVTENTFDAYLMNIIVTKQRFISQLFDGKTNARSCEDVDEAVLNYSEMQALASGDKRIKEKIELDGEVARLKVLESEHYNEQYRLDDTIQNCEKWIHSYSASIDAAKRDIEFAAANKPSDDSFKIEIEGKTYTQRKPAGEAICKQAIKHIAQMDGDRIKPIGTFCGFEFSVERKHNGFATVAAVSLRRELTYSTDIDITGDIGNITRLENLFNKGLDKKLTEITDKLAVMQTDLNAALATKGKPFEHAEELAQKSARLEQLNLELEVGKTDEVVMSDEPEIDNRIQTEKIEKNISHQHKR